MAQLIGFLVAMIIVYYIPYKIDQKNDEIRRQNTRNRLNQQSRDEMEKWRK